MAAASYSPEDITNNLVPIPLSDDVLTKARNARKNQGIHETEVSFSGEAGLHDSLNSCEKNPQHVGFTPITQLEAANLPEPLRDANVVKFLVLKAQETVRLTVDYTSPARPSGYCFSEYVGETGMTRVGSGRVWSVYRDRVKYDVPCPFDGCREVGITTGRDDVSVSQESEETNYADEKTRGQSVVGRSDVRLYHTGHVVDCRAAVEESEAGENCETRCCENVEGNEHGSSHVTGKVNERNNVSENNDLVDRLKEGGTYTGASATNQHQPEPRQNNQHFVSGYFRIHTAKHVVFDTAEAQHTTVEFFYDDPKDTRHVIRARGVQVTRSDIDGDFCVMDCVSHDPRLGEVLDAVRHDWEALWPSVKDKLYGQDISLVVSHPHGCSKQFSLGRCLKREWGEGGGGQCWYRYTYTAATCPGSSGAPVWVPGGDGLFSGYAPHSGCPAPGQAASAVWFFWNFVDKGK